MIQQRPTILVLAAGRGMRFQGSGHKLEQSLGSETLLAHTRPGDCKRSAGGGGRQ